MANQLDMRKSLAIKQLHKQGMSQRNIAQTLGVSRGAVIRHLDADCTNSTKAQTGEVPTGFQESNSTKAPTGSKATANAPDWATEPSDSSAKTRSRSRSASFHQLILDKLAFGKKLQIVPKRQPGHLPIRKNSNSTNLTLEQSPALKWSRSKRKHAVSFESQIDGLTFAPV